MPTTDMKPAMELRNSIELCAGTSTGLGLSLQDLQQYRSLTDMLADIGEGQAHFLPLCFSSIHFSDRRTQEDLSAELSQATQQSLERHMYESVSRKTDEAASKGLLSFMPTVMGVKGERARLGAYVDFLVRSNPRHFPSVSSTGTGAGSLWVVVYFFMRFGRLEAALTELKYWNAQSVGSVSQEMITLLEYVVRIHAHVQDRTQQVLLSMSEQQELAAVLTACSNDYSTQPHGADPYRSTVLNLLTLVDPDLNEVGGDVRYFLWQHLWFDNYSQALQRRACRGASPGPVPVTRHVDLYARILAEGGADYFDKTRANPLGYALILFACQRFGDAIAYLWDCKQYIPAAHFTVLCCYYGLVLPYAPLTENPPRTCIDPCLQTDTTTTSASLILLFVKTFLSAHDAARSLDYIATVSTAYNPAYCTTVRTVLEGMDQKMLELCQTKMKVCSDETFKAFIKSLDASQLRPLTVQPGGRMYEYCTTPAEVRRHLMNTAFEVREIERNPEAAIALYEIAGEYGLAVEQITFNLAQAIAPSSTVSSTSEDRLFWRRLAADFYERYIHAPVPSTVRTSTAPVDLPPALLAEFNSVFHLSLFFSQSSERGSEEDALRTLDEAGYLPRSAAHVDAVALALASAGTNVQALIDDMLLHAMHQLHVLARSASSTVGGTGGLASDAMLKARELRLLAGYVLALGRSSRLHGVMRNQTDTCTRLARIEEDMQ